MNAGELLDALRRGAGGTPREEAAVRLLAGHGYWVRRMASHPEAFGLEITTADRAGPVVSPDWDAIGQRVDRGELAATGSQASVLRIACSLGGGFSIGLGKCLGELDAGCLHLVLETLTRANGERRTSRPGALYRVTLALCGDCLGGVGGWCYSPGCSLHLTKGPSTPITYDADGRAIGVDGPLVPAEAPGAVPRGGGT